MRIILLIITLLFTSCSIKEVNTPPTLEKSLHVKKKYVNIDKKWWKEYNDEKLNTLVQMALQRNIQLKKGKLTIEKSLLNLGIANLDRYPSFSGGFGGNYSKDLEDGESSKNFNANLSLSYQVDVWGKIRDNYNAKIYEYNATKEELDAIKLGVTNKVINAYFNLSYINDTYKITEESMKNYEQLQRITQDKYKYGRVDTLQVEQAKENLLNVRNSLLELKKKKANACNELINLLNLKDCNSLGLKDSSLQEITFLHVKENMSLAVMLFRPDLKALELKLASSFNNQKALSKSIYPDVSLGASVSSQDDTFSDSFTLNIFGGNFRVTLPFLDYKRVQNNINISKTQYDIEKLDFEESLTKALNELELFYKEYQISKQSYAIYEKKLSVQNKILRYQKDKYELGRAAFWEYIDALNALLNSRENFIYQKYLILQNENRIFQSTGGQVY